MAKITLNGKEYTLKFTYRTILALEKHYNMGIGKIFKELDMENLNVLNTFVYVCLKREKDFANATEEDVAIALDDAFENEEITFDDLANAIQDAIENSVIVKQGEQGNGKKRK